MYLKRRTKEEQFHAGNVNTRVTKVGSAHMFGSNYCREVLDSSSGFEPCPVL